MNYEKKAERLMEILHDIKHHGDTLDEQTLEELYDKVIGIFPNFREVESYNPERHSSAKDYLFDVVLKGVK